MKGVDILKYFVMHLQNIHGYKGGINMGIFSDKPKSIEENSEIISEIEFQIINCQIKIKEVM